MHSSLVRIQQIFGFLTTVAFFLGTLIALTVTVFPGTPTATVNVKNVNVVYGRQSYYSSRQNEYAFIKFDLDADLDTLFNWNTKQIFVYLTATYPGDKYTTNEAVVWDRILHNKKEAVLHFKQTKSKYNIHDITGKFNARNATMAFHWNVQPHVGALLWDTMGKQEFDFTKVKSK